MCMPSWLPNFCMDVFVVKLKPRIGNEQVRVKNGKTAYFMYVVLQISVFP